MGFPDGSVVKNLSAVWEMWVQSLAWEYSLKKEMTKKKKKGNDNPF